MTQRWPKPIFSQADEDKDAHWSEGMEQGGDAWNAEFEDRTTSIHTFGGLGAKAPKTSEWETKPLKVGRRVLKEKWDAPLSELYRNKFQVKSASKATLSRPDVLIDVVMGGGHRGGSREVR